MLLDAAEKFNLVGKMQQFLPDYRFNVSVHANNAVRMKNIRERFQRTVMRENPDGFIIMAGQCVNPTRIIIEYIPFKMKSVGIS